LDTGGGVTRRPNGAGSLHILARSYHVPTPFKYFFVFLKYQNTPDLTQNLQKKKNGVQKT